MKHKCDLCGTPVKVVGNVTKHYEADLPSLEDLEEILDSFSYQGVSGHDKLIWRKETRALIAKEIFKRINE